MEGLVPIAIWLSLALVALGLLVIVVFGVRGLLGGKHRPWSIGAMLLPLVVFGIAYVVSSGSDSPTASAMILTALILIVAGVAAILATGVKGVFN